MMDIIHITLAIIDQLRLELAQRRESAMCNDDPVTLTYNEADRIGSELSKAQRLLTLHQEAAALLCPGKGAA